MIINLLPQISKKTAERIIKEFAEKGQIEESDISKIQNEEIKNIYWTPVGQGSRKILADKLFILREQIIQLAENYGFRNSMPNKFLEFEYKLAILFTDQNYCDFLWNDGYPTGETLRNSFWSYLTIILLPILLHGDGKFLKVANLIKHGLIECWAEQEIHSKEYLKE